MVAIIKENNKIPKTPISFACAIRSIKYISRGEKIIPKQIFKYGFFGKIFNPKPKDTAPRKYIAKKAIVFHAS